MVSQSGAERLEAAFAAAREERRALLVGYLPAGFPSVTGCRAGFQAMLDGGVDVLEVGLPYSDPLIDGPTIQAAVDRALAAGTRVRDVLATTAAVAERAPALVMTYWNPVEQYGVERFAAELADAGGAGLITPDLIPDEAEPWLAAAREHDLARVFLVAPSSTDERLRMVASVNRGFVYAASTMGVTGARTEIGSRARELVERMRAVTLLPIGVGLGVSNGAQAREVAGYADAVIVGSAFVRAVLDAPSEQAGVAALRELAAELADGVRTAQPVGSA